MKPSCWNREAFTDPNAGWVDTGRKLGSVYSQTDLHIVIYPRPVYRYRHPWFTDRCTVHDKADIGPGQTYAQHHGWDCSGCRWRPEGV